MRMQASLRVKPQARIEKWCWVIGHWAFGIGHWALGIGHWALDIGHWAFSIQHSTLKTHHSLLTIQHSIHFTLDYQSLQKNILHPIPTLSKSP
jgi:hypothetical protein